IYSNLLTTFNENIYQQIFDISIDSPLS
ncbi:hypothetical protein EAG_00763, partial [Camponotus floridanus]